MQAVKTRTAIPVGQTYCRRNPTPKRIPLRNKEKTKNYGAKRCRNAFLKTKLSPIAPKELIREWNSKNINYLTQENYQYLLDSAMQYVGLLGDKLQHIPAAYPGKSISDLYRDLCSKIGDLNLNIEIIEDKLAFVVWDYHKWDDEYLYWIPLKFIESLSGRLRKITVTFMHEFARSNCIETIDKCPDTEMTLEYLEDNLEDFFPVKDEEYLEHYNLLQSYQSGPISQFLNEVDSKSYYKHLSSAILRYSAKNEFEAKLIEFLQEGLQFIGKSKPSIMNYTYDLWKDDETYCFPIELDRIVRLIYDDNDWVTEHQIRFLSDELQMNYAMSPITCLFLSPEMKCTFRKDDYPERLGEWILNFNMFLYDN